MYSRSSAKMIMLVGVWLALIAGGIWVSLEYEKTPSKVVKPAALSNPLPEILVDNAKEFRLVVFAHPKCPCTKATLSELARFLTKNGNVSSQVFFIVPAGLKESWAQTETFAFASHIPEVEVKIDYDGALAKTFGADASGECFLLDRKAKVLFHGGITLARGHEGDNIGLDQLTAIVQRKSDITATNVVYGCGLFDSKVKTGN